MVFSDAFLTCVNTEATALRTGALSLVTVQEQDTLEPLVTAVSSLSFIPSAPVKYCLSSEL